MTCEDLTPLLGRFADGELEPDCRGAAAAHLERCSSCRAELLAIEALGELARDLPVPPLPADLWDRITQQVSVPQVVGRVPRWNRANWLRIATVAALVLLAVYTGWLAHGPRPDTDPAPVAVDLGPYLDRALPATFAGGDSFTFAAAPLERANEQVAFRLFDGAHLPEGYRARRCLVGCCGNRALVQTEYQREKDACVVFQYPREVQVAFGNSFPVEAVRVGDRAITVVQGTACWAASWEVGGSGVTILGPRNRDILLRLVAHVDQALQGENP